MELRADCDPRKGCLNCNRPVGHGTAAIPYFIMKPIDFNVEQMERIGSVCSKSCRDELDYYLKWN